MTQGDLGFDAAPVLAQWAPQQWPVDAGWQGVVHGFLASPPGQRLAAFVTARLAAGATVYPPQPFRALQLTALDAVKVVILGPGPLPWARPGRGAGVFSRTGRAAAASLRNIFKERQRSLGLGPFLSRAPWRAGRAKAFCCSTPA
jgi:uracil-DNA glycosylase